MSLHAWQTGSWRGSRLGTQTWPHNASIGVPLMRASSTLAVAVSPGPTLTMWATEPGSWASTSSCSSVVVGAEAGCRVLMADLPGSGRSVVVAGVDVDAGHTLAVEHVHVAGIVLEREAQVEPELPQLGDAPLLEDAGSHVVA